MSLAGAYSPKDWESQITAQWRKWGIGSPETQVAKQSLVSDAPTFTVIMPPPNLTAKLHAGHAMNHYLQDTLARVHRQRGYKTLVFPGVDHAGLQLEGVINKLLASQGIDRKSLSTEEYLKICWQKVSEWRDDQSKQALMMGTSADYTRELFTLDDKANKMVVYAFEQYWKDGLIYKSSYIVNWSVGLQTALSDVSGEIVYETRKDPLVTFRYGVSEIVIGEGASDELKTLSSKLLKALTKHPIQVSTVRPETIFGDVAIAIHPSRLRMLLHKSYNEDELGILQKALESGDLIITQQLPEFGVSARVLLSDKVDADFGTGTLKVTPGSDIVDYELYTQDFAQYNLPKYIHTITREGRLSQDVTPEFQGLSREEARIKSIELLIRSGYIATLEEMRIVPQEYNKITGAELYDIDWNYEHNVSLCERTKTVIEPLVSEEFYLSYKNPTSREGKTLQELGKIGVSQTNFYPIEFRSMADNFLDGIRDWCISRDLVWGHRIPVWYNLVLNPTRRFFVPQAKTIEIDGVEYTLGQLMRVQSHKPVEEGEWVQEDKILDTWFSSSLWPLTTLGYYTTNPKVSAIVTDISGVFWDESNTERKEVVEFLKYAKQAGIEIYYLSNMDNQAMYEKFVQTPHYELFAGGVSAYESGQNKRSSVMYELLLAKYNLDASKVLYVDDVSEYVVQAKEAGLNAYWYTPNTDLLEILNHLLEEKHSDFEEYYPTNYMNTAKEIFYLWIVRMVVLGMYFAGSTPFKNVLITPTVLDSEGKKMSKSLGNGLDPETAIEAFSSDSLRLGVLSGVLPNRNMRFGGSIADRTMEKMRNFGNKLWNIGRFLEAKEAAKASQDSERSPATEWMYAEYYQLIEAIDQLDDRYEFVPVVEKLIDCVWYKLADSYIEYLKTDESQLGHAWELYRKIVIAVHPFLPFETEVLYRELYGAETVVYERVEEVPDSYLIKNGVVEFSTVLNLVDMVRSIKGMYGIKPTEAVEIASKHEMVAKYSKLLSLLCKASITSPQESWLTTQVGDIDLSLDIAHHISDIATEIAKTESEVTKLTGIITGLEVRLANPKFLDNAEPEAITDAKNNILLSNKQRDNLKSKLVYLHKLAA
jgi:valyl-tRNA synthetase